MRYVSSCANSGSAATAAAAVAAAAAVMVAAAAVLVTVVVAVAAGALRLVVAGAMRGDARRLSRRSRCCCCGGGGGTAVVVVGHLPYLAGAQRTFLIWQVLCASLVEAVGAQAQLTAQCTGHVREIICDIRRDHMRYSPRSYAIFAEIISRLNSRCSIAQPPRSYEIFAEIIRNIRRDHISTFSRCSIALQTQRQSRDCTPPRRHRAPLARLPRWRRPSIFAEIIWNIAEIIWNIRRDHMEYSP